MVGTYIYRRHTSGCGGGAWIVAVKGFAGISEQNGRLVCRPCLPKKWKGMSFKLMYANKIYSITITADDVSIT